LKARSMPAFQGRSGQFPTPLRAGHKLPVTILA